VEEGAGRGGGLLRILFWGTPRFALPSLRALGEEGHDLVGVVTQPDRPKGRGRKPSPSPVKEVALEEGIPLLTPEKPWGPEFEGEVRRLEPILIGQDPTRTEEVWQAMYGRGYVGGPVKMSAGKALVADCNSAVSFLGMNFMLTNINYDFSFVKYCSLGFGS